jgi:hypothetical protein
MAFYLFRLLVQQAIFDGVERLLAAGMPNDQVGFQLAFNKNELKAAIQLYPGPLVCCCCFWGKFVFSPK